ncbi:Gfo/Idh/MocA family oxidoreductase [Seohaeicola saemankumensis]|nr:Gfo/Idh/MocA family oxidoreductase [Seohaeicola saemankumensis]MCA0869672.1 Gfo/Idh/MocA family oxidoreductase [Seohaeicola saemankumensis]
MIRWGILGASKFAREHMGPAIHAARGAELSALATASPDKAAGFRDFCPGLRLHDSYEALLADSRIDAVYVPLPNHLHVEWTLKALKAGKHVLCEKPMTLRAPEFDQLIAERDRAGRLAAEAFMIVHHPQWAWVRAQIARGVIGRLAHISGRFSFDNRDGSNIRNRAETGGGALRDIGVYVMGAARFVTGEEPTEVGGRIRRENGIDTFADISARFTDCTYNAYVSIRMHPAQEMVFHGDGGLIRVTTPFNANVFGEARVELHRPGLEVTTKRWPAANHYITQVEAFGQSAETGADYPCPLEFSRGTQAMMDAVFAKAAAI